MNIPDMLEEAARYCERQQYLSYIIVRPEGLQLRMRLTPNNTPFNYLVGWKEIEDANFNIVIAKLQQLETTMRKGSSL